MGFLVRLGFVLLLVRCAGAAQAENFASKVKQARELTTAGKYGEAIPLYRGLLREAPNNPSIHTNLGYVLHMAGHEQEALSQFEAALKADPSYVDANFYLGASLLSIANAAKAVEPLQRVVESQPSNKQGRELLGEAFLSLRRFESAVEQFRKLSELDPANPKAWSGLGRSYEGLAQESIARLGETAPHSAYPLVLIADARLAQRQYEPAFFFYREARTKSPALRGVHTALAEIYRQTGHADWAATEEARERLLPTLNCGEHAHPEPRREEREVPFPSAGAEAAQQLECAFWAGRYQDVVDFKNLKTAEGYYWRAKAYTQLEAEAFSHLMQFLPLSAEAHEFKATIEFSRKAYDKAAKEWQEALKLSPGSLRIQKELALSLDMNGNHEAARQVLQELVRKVPSSAELNYLLGETLLSLEKKDEAIRYLEAAVQAQPTLFEARRELAHAYLQTGQERRAIPHLKVALAGDEDAKVYYMLARAYRRTGQPQLAEQMLAKFRELQKTASTRENQVMPKVQITPP